MLENPIKIAVVPFRVKSSGAFDVDLARLIESNLERSGQFVRVRRDTMLSLPGPEDQIFYRDWRAIDSEYTVVGSVERDAQGLLVRYGLHDVFGERVLFAERIPGNAGIIERYRALYFRSIMKPNRNQRYFLNTFAIRFSGTTF